MGYFKACMDGANSFCGFTTKATACAPEAAYEHGRHLLALQSRVEASYSPESPSLGGAPVKTIIPMT